MGLGVAPEGSPSIADPGVLLQGAAQGGDLLRTALQHAALHGRLEGAVEVLEGLRFVQREDLADMTQRHDTET